LRDHHNSEARTIESQQAQQFILAEPGGEDDQEGGNEGPIKEPLIVAEMLTEVPTLSVGEAVMRLDLGNHPALMFRNAAHGGYNMIYRRPDGHIGWIDPSVTLGGKTSV
jgi:hypothetical protein